MMVEKRLDRLGQVGLSALPSMSTDNDFLMERKRADELEEDGSSFLISRSCWQMQAFEFYLYFVILLR